MSERGLSKEFMAWAELQVIAVYFVAMATVPPAIICFLLWASPFETIWSRAALVVWIACAGLHTGSLVRSGAMVEVREKTLREMREDGFDV